MHRDRPALFFKEFLRSPSQVGTVIPSSRFLESRLVRIGQFEAARLVVELGPGTGGTTGAILQALPPDARLIAIERNADFIQRLREIADRRISVHHASAEDLEAVLEGHGMPRPDVVLSGIPFSTIPAAVGQRILRVVWDVLAPGGRFVAYQVRGRVEALARHLMGTPQVEYELLNVPPLRVYCWRKPVAPWPPDPAPGWMDTVPLADAVPEYSHGT
jgi:phospholipid N-methyltransferase